MTTVWMTVMVAVMSCSSCCERVSPILSSPILPHPSSRATLYSTRHLALYQSFSLMGDVALPAEQVTFTNLHFFVFLHTLITRFLPRTSTLPTAPSRLQHSRPVVKVGFQSVGFCQTTRQRRKKRVQSSRSPQLPGTWQESSGNQF